MILNWTTKSGRLRTFSVIFEAGGWTLHNREQFDHLVGVAWLNSIGHDVWYSLHYIRTDAVYGMLACGGRASEKEVQAVTCIAADIDAGKPGYPTQAEVLVALERCPLAPSMVNLSGKADGGVHAYWMLDEPFRIESSADRTRIKDISRRWQLDVLKPLLDGQGKLDSTYDLARVLRPAGTVNHKYGCVVEPIEQTDARYTLAEIGAALPEPANPTTYTSTAGTAPGAYAPPPDRTGRPPASLAVLQRAAAYAARCEPAISGRNGHTQTLKVAAALVRGFDLTPAEAYPILAAYNATCSPPWSEAELTHKLASVDAYNDPRGRGWLLGDVEPDDSPEPLDLSALFAETPPASAENSPENPADGVTESANCPSYRREETPLRQVGQEASKQCPNMVPILAVKEGGIGRVLVPCGKRGCSVCGVAWRDEWRKTITDTVYWQLFPAGSPIHYGTVATDEYDTIRRSAARRAARDGTPWGYAAVSTGLNEWLLVATAPFPGSETLAVDPENRPFRFGSEIRNLPIRFDSLVEKACEEARWSLATRPVRLSQNWRDLGKTEQEKRVDQLNREQAETQEQQKYHVIPRTAVPTRAAFHAVATWLGESVHSFTGRLSGIHVEWIPELFCPADESTVLIVNSKGLYVEVLDEAVVAKARAFAEACKLYDDGDKALAHAFVETELRPMLAA